jgi:hypothetical protein
MTGRTAKERMMKDLFDGVESDRLKEEGMKAAAENAITPLELAREIAYELAMKHGTVNADMVGHELWIRHGIKTLGPAAGSLFKGDKWQWTGEYMKSERKKNHSRMLRVWRLAMTRRGS